MNTSNNPQDTKTDWKTGLRLLGPGLLFAGAAVGVSHLVQATKAGAIYGFGLLWVVLFIHLAKYPFFEFGPRYAAATGESLLHGYKKLGNWAVALFVIVTVGTMFTVQAAVTIVTAGLAINLFGIMDNAVYWSFALLSVCAIILIIGKYGFLDNLMKVIIFILTVSTLFAVGLALGKTPITPSFSQVLPIDSAMSIAFLIALMGWMPAPLDLSVWHSLWANEKKKTSTDDFSFKRSLLDFNIGYAGTIILAVAFLSLGALIMHQSGATFAETSGAFAAQVISLYTTVLGDWAKWIIALAAFTTMFSTTLTCFDAIPRVMSKTVGVIRNQEEESPRAYWFWMAVLMVGSLILLSFFIQSMGQMVKVATILSFLTTPFFAVANYILVTGKHTPEFARPSFGLKVLSWFGIVFLVGFSVLYLFSLA